MAHITFTNGRSAETGCYVGGHWGQYVYDQIAKIADDLAGTSLAGVIPTARELDRDDLVEILVEVGDQAIDALNEITPDGYLWTWEDGEIYLMSLDDEDGE